MGKARIAYLLLAALFLASLAGIGNPRASMAAEPELIMAVEPERSISLSTTFLDITIGKEQDVKLSIMASNRGEVDEDMEITISSAPEGWEARLTDRDWGTPYSVRGLHIAAGEEEPKTIYFQTQPPAQVEQGDYTFILKAIATDKQVESSLKISIRVEEKATVLEKVKLSTTYPVLRGPSGASFEFGVDIVNEGSEDHSFDLSATAPPQWEISFRPSYEQKQISTIGIKARETQKIEVELSPPEDAPPGNYVIPIEASSGNIKGAIDLAIVLTGTRELDLSTATGRLNTEATSGQEHHLSLVLASTGSDEVRDIDFSSSKPGGWVVTFNPDKLDSLATKMSREIDVTIKPTGKTIAGDYEVTLRATGFGASDEVSLRVAVGTSTTWGWIGIGIILLVVAGVLALFQRLGRR
ncbi:NEW3 domain-containing protein [Chloroflexota bacterium]